MFKFYPSTDNTAQLEVLTVLREFKSGVVGELKDNRGCLALTTLPVCYLIP
uniref:Uncharacterized protein n=1 Tax=Arion vulgaris TaxID=1028688 RepID=A0A0B7AQZ5_9EUPU